MLRIVKRIGCPKEIMSDEARVGLLPDSARELRKRVIAVNMERSAGRQSGFSDAQYEKAGALLSKDRRGVWASSDLIVKVKQPLEEEFPLMQKNSTIFCFMHLADNTPLLDELLQKRITAIAYETIQREDESPHILAAMSKVAGRKAFFDGGNLLEKHKGMLIGPQSKVLILGLGNAGKTAAELVAATRPKFLYLLDKNPAVFDSLRQKFYRNLSPGKIWFVEHDQDNPIHQRALAAMLSDVDLLIAAPHVPGELQGKIVPKWMIKKMKRGSVVMDISIDQGGAVETSEHREGLKRQVFMKHGVVHYCVPNIPGAVPSDSTPALCRETFPYIAELAQKGLVEAVRENPALARGVNTFRGWITHEGLAKSIGRMERYRHLSEIMY